MPRKRPNRNKFHTQKQKIDGFSFDSKAEAKYYVQVVKPLRSDFKVHPSYEIIPKEKIGDGKPKRKRIYSPDFVIYDSYGHIKKVVDVKPKKITADASLRMRMFEHCYEMPVTIARYDYKSGLFVESEF